MLDAAQSSLDLPVSLSLGDFSATEAISAA